VKRPTVTSHAVARPARRSRTQPGWPLRPLRRRSSPWSRRSRGQSIVELAIIAPVVLLLLAAALDLGRLFYSQITIANAAREGALAAAQDPTKYEPGQSCVAPAHGPATNRIICAIQKETKSSALSVPASAISMACDGTVVATAAQVTANCVASMDHTIEITVTGQFSLVTPLLSTFVGGQTIALSSTATSVPREIPPTPPPAPTSSPSPSSSSSSSPSSAPSGSPDPSASVAPSASAAPSSTASAAPSPSPSASMAPTCLAPIASFSWSPFNPSKKTNVTFLDTSTNMNVPACGLQWTWSFGDGSGGSTLKNPVYSYQFRGTYSVTLLVTNSAGSDQRTQTISVTN
jgi:Flp pilus assembly protein TadG